MVLRYDMIDMNVPAESMLCSVFRKRTPTETEQQVDDRNDCLFYAVFVAVMNACLYVECIYMDR